VGTKAFWAGLKSNPLVNPGAITATSMVAGANRDAIWKSILGFYSDFRGRSLAVNQEVFQVGEATRISATRQSANLMYAY